MSLMFICRVVIQLDSIVIKKFQAREDDWKLLNLQSKGLIINPFVSISRENEYTHILQQHGKFISCRHLLAIKKKKSLFYVFA